MDVLIRQAKESDFNTVQELSAALTVSDSKYDPILVKNWSFTKEGVKYINKRLAANKCICIVAEYDNEVIGYATATVLKNVSWRPMKKRVELENLIIKEEFRGKGVGEKLINAFFEWGRKMKADRAIVHSYFNNKGAVKFYQRNGLVPLTVELERLI
jgi:GNAT superfamily N-acetyltransferase